MIFQCFVSFRFSSYFKDTMFVCECVRYRVLIERETVSALPPPLFRGPQRGKSQPIMQSKKDESLIKSCLLPEQVKVQVFSFGESS